MKKTVLVVLVVFGLILWAQGLTEMVRAENVLWEDGDGDRWIDVTGAGTNAASVVYIPPELDAEFNALRARITKLEAELRRTAALVYIIAGAAARTSGPICEMQIVEPMFSNEIDECLANVTIKEEKE